jgi:hypothetical protein
LLVFQGLGVTPRLLHTAHVRTRNSSLAKPNLMAMYPAAPLVAAAGPASNIPLAGPFGVFGFHAFLSRVSTRLERIAIKRSNNAALAAAEESQAAAEGTE